MKIAICRSAKAYLPETEAYAEYLHAKGVEARCVDDRREIAPEETAILFRFEDQVARDVQARRRVHEDHNRPTGVRGWARRALTSLGPQPDGRILLEQVGEVRGSAPTLRRACGVDPALFQLERRKDPDFDLVYCGTLDRPGVVGEIEHLANQGFRVAVYGRVPPGTPQSRMEAAGVRFFGRIGRHEVAEAIANARAGLNFTPDRAPWNEQESVKTLEYLAARLPVVSNRYAWAEQFAAARRTEFLWLDHVEGPESLDEFEPPRADMADRAWPTLLDNVGFVPFLERVSA